VKSSCLRAAIAASLLTTFPAVFAADEVKPPVHSELFDASFAAMRELQADDNSKLGLIERLDRLERFRHSPEIAGRLLKLYGTERPLSFARASAPEGQVGYRASLAPLKYTGQDGSAVDWVEASASIMLDKAGRNVTVDGSWPAVNFEDKQVRMSLRDITLAATQHQGAGGLWFGNFQVALGSLVAEPKAQDTGPSITLEGMRMSTAVTDHGKTSEMGYQFGIKNITVAGLRVDDIRLALRITNIDNQAMVAMKTATEKNKARMAGMTPEQQAAVVKPIFKELMRSAVMRGAAIELDDLSAGYGGNRASVKGRITVKGASAKDLDSMPALLKKLVGRFDVRVPLALVREVSGVIARKQIAAQQGAGANPDPQALAQLTQTITDIAVGKLVSGGFARVENDAVVSTIELRDGKLFANGKEVSLPKPNPAPGAPAGGNDQFLQARRVEESCRLPEYPVEVVRDDAPLKLTLRFVVGADGHLGQIAVAQPSRWPAWDQAVLAAAASCRYIPALRGGKPVPMPAQWTVKREPGSTRP
jgi:TonB family protein